MCLMWISSVDLTLLAVSNAVDAGWSSPDHRDSVEWERGPAKPCKFATASSSGKRGVDLSRF